MPPAARVGDNAVNPADAHGCLACPHPVIGAIIKGSPDVFTNGTNAARKDDPGHHTACCQGGRYTISAGSATVFINGHPAARLGDSTDHCGGSGTIIEGSSNVMIGDAGGGGGGGGKSKGGGVGSSKLKPGDLASATQPEHVLNMKVAKVGDVTWVGQEKKEEKKKDAFAVSVTDNFSGVDLDAVKITAAGADVSSKVKKSLSGDGQTLRLDFEFEEGEVAPDADVRVEASLPDGTKIARSWKYKP
jgi:uncharacterized Zn-binding protein involved in type VI secretion